MRDNGCCANSNDCISTNECVGGTCSATQPSAGVCRIKPTGNSCWTNADCSLLAPNCTGASLCPCNADCILPVKMGTCQLLATTLSSDNQTDN
jgi:hypothetical protein